MKQVLYDWGDLNLRLFQTLNGHSWHGADTLMILMGYLTDIWTFPLYLGIWALSVAKLKGTNPTHAAYVQLQLHRFIGGYLAVLIAASAIKYGLDFSRPVRVLGEHGVHVLGRFDLEHSLPSGHATFAMLLAATVWPLLAVPARAAAIIFVAWAGLARVWSGAHFPADVVAGYILGLACALLSALVILRPVGFRRFQLERDTNL